MPITALAVTAPAAAEVRRHVRAQRTRARATRRCAASMRDAVLRARRMHSTRFRGCVHRQAVLLPEPHRRCCRLDTCLCVPTGGDASAAATRPRARSGRLAGVRPRVVAVVVQVSMSNAIASRLWRSLARRCTPCGRSIRCVETAEALQRPRAPSIQRRQPRNTQQRRTASVAIGSQEGRVQIDAALRFRIAAWVPVMLVGPCGDNTARPRPRARGVSTPVRGRQRRRPRVSPPRARASSSSGNSRMVAIGSGCGGTRDDQRSCITAVVLVVSPPNAAGCPSTAQRMQRFGPRVGIGAKVVAVVIGVVPAFAASGLE